MLKRSIDQTDCRLLLALLEDARSTVVMLAYKLGVSRNTVQARLSRLTVGDVLAPIDRCVEPAALGYPLTAFVAITVTQQKLESVAHGLAQIPEVLEAIGTSGATDVLVRVAAKSPEHLYQVVGQILSLTGVHRSETSLASRRLVDFRVRPLLETLLDKV